MNGVSMPEERHTVAHHLKTHGYNTALLGKAHFEPWLGSPDDFFENRMALEESTGPHRGFDHMELANHFFEGHSHYDRFMEAYPETKARFYPMVTNKGQNTIGKTGTGAIQVWPMDVPPGAVSHPMGSGSNQSLVKRAKGRYPLVLLDEFPRPAPSLGCPRVRIAQDQLAGSSPAGTVQRKT